MPEIIACPDCGRKLRVPDDLLGRKVKCPGCGINFTASVVGGGPPPVPQAVGTEPRAERRRDDRDDRDDDRPRRRDEDEYDERDEAPRSLRDSWKKVRLGLNFVIISIWVYLGAVGVQFIGMLFLGGLAWDSVTSFNASGAYAAGTGMIVLGLFVMLATVASLGLKVTGFGMGLAVPPKRNNAVRGLGIATFILGASEAALLLIAVIVIMVNDMGMLASSFGYSALTAGTGMGPLLLLEFLTWAACMIVFLFYLRSLCLAIRKDNLASTVTTFMISVGGLGLVVALLFLFIVGVGVSHRGGGPLYLLGCGLGILSFAATLGMFIWYIVILHQIKYAVHSHLRKL